MGLKKTDNTILGILVLSVGWGCVSVGRVGGVFLWTIQLVGYVSENE